MSKKKLLEFGLKEADAFQKNFKVYNRENKNCVRKNCKGKIIKIFISNRSSFFCKFCQK